MIDEPLQPNEYRCDMCKQVYTKGLSDEEAMAETNSYWPGVAQEDCAVICDDCWEKVRPERHPDVYMHSLVEELLQVIRKAGGA